MSPAKREPRSITLAEIAARFDVAGASYWWSLGDRRRWCPAVHQLGGGRGYAIRFVKSKTVSGDDVRTAYDYFELDADGLITVAPRGFAREYKPGRVVDIAAAAERYATPDPDAARIGLPAMTVNTRLTEMTVCALPEDNVNHHLFAITVQWRGGETYAVKRLSEVLGADGEWGYEPLPSSRDEAWIATHRFSYFEACRLAIEAAPHVTVNGHAVADVLAAAERKRT